MRFLFFVFLLAPLFALADDSDPCAFHALKPWTYSRSWCTSRQTEPSKKTEQLKRKVTVAESEANELGRARKEEMANYDKKLDSLIKQKDKEQESIRQLEEKINVEKTIIANGPGQPNKNDDAVYIDNPDSIYQSGQRLRDLRKSLEATKKQIDATLNGHRALMVERGEAEAAHDQKILAKKMEGTESSELAASSYLADKVANLDARYRAAAAYASITEVKMDEVSLEMSLQSLENVVDRSPTGIYMREKMLKMFKPGGPLCKAQKACDGGDEVTYKDLESVFSVDGRAMMKQLTKPSGNGSTKSNGSAK